MNEHNPFNYCVKKIYVSNAFLTNIKIEMC